MQRVVFNANYFVYLDDAVDMWTRHALSVELAKAGSSTDLHAIGFDFMLKTLCIVKFLVGAIAVSMLQSTVQSMVTHVLMQ
jgi:hypothetical protein